MPRESNAPRFTRRELLRGLAAAGVGTIVGTVDHGYMYQRHHIALTRETIRVSGLSDDLSGLRVGFLSDLHRSEMVSHEMAETAVRALMSERPDLIVLGGDYVTWGGGRSRRFVGAAAEVLAPLAAPPGVFAILGNHDDDRDMPAARAARGVAVLRDARTRLTIRGETLDLAGIRFWTRRAEDIASVIRGASSNLILLAHTP
ncbi:MAG: metallophosphoesterase, partial [Acidobacteria bacterium]|nr:metallophosphoesterase [Acidobacteriota bacterium]